MLSRFYQLRYGLRPRALHRLRQPAPQGRAHPARLLHPRQLPARLHRQPATRKRDFYDKKVVLLVRSPQDVAVSQYFQWKFRMRPRKKALNEYPEHGAEVDALRLRDGRGRGPAEDHRLHERLGARSCRALRAAADRPLRGPARRHRGRARRASLRVPGRSRRRRGAAPAASPSPSVENMRKLEDEARLLAGRRAHDGRRQGQSRIRSRCAAPRSAATATTSTTSRWPARRAIESGCCRVRLLRRAASRRLPADARRA